MQREKKNKFSCVAVTEHFLCLIMLKLLEKKNKFSCVAAHWAFPVLDYVEITAVEIFEQIWFAWLELSYDASFSAY